MRLSGWMIWLIMVICLCGGTFVVGGVPEPYLPKPVSAAEASVIAPEELALKFADGTAFKPGQFSVRRRLDGKWRISELERSSRPFDGNVDMDKGIFLPAFDDSKWAEIDVPLSWHIKYPESMKRNEPYVKGWYRHKFSVSAQELAGNRIFLHFGAIGCAGHLFINGKAAGTHLGDFTPWEIDVTGYVKEGENQLALKVLRDYGPMHGANASATHVYGPQYGMEQIKAGLWQPVEIRLEKPVRFIRVRVNPDLAGSKITFDYEVENNSSRKISARLDAFVSPAMSADAASHPVVAGLGQVELVPGVYRGKGEVVLDHPSLWTPEKPYLYFLTLALREKEQPIAAIPVRFGMRSFKVEGGDFYLNGKRIYLFGENIPAMHYEGMGRTPEAESRRIRERLKRFKSLGYNIIRNAHTPMSPALTRAADEIGMMIYNEWGWCFTSKIDEEAFERNNSREVSEWVYRNYNHPSVVMWSGGNEIVYKNSPVIKRQLEAQYDLIRKLDVSGRPVCVFSGVGASSYGTEKIKTDVIDIHTYVGLGRVTWTGWDKSSSAWYRNILGVFGNGGKLDQAFIIWECVGFSWGNKIDPKFKADDVRAYGEYVKRPTSWSEPNGIGFAGTIGLAAALDPERNNKYGQEVYGRRIAEQIRQDLRIKGFAPWFHGCTLQMARLWTQPLFCGIKDATGILPRNLFSGRDYSMTFFAANCTGDDINNATLRVSLAVADGTEKNIAEISLAGLKSWTVSEQKIGFHIPESQDASYGQLRLTLSAGKQELSRNFYDIFIQSTALTGKKIITKIPVAVLDGKTPQYLEKLTGIFNDMGLAHQVINDTGRLSSYKLLVVPPMSAAARQSLDVAKLGRWVSDGGTLLMLEQMPGELPLPGDFSVESSPNTFVDLVIFSHPVFKGLKPCCFDTWNNPDYGYVVKNMITPFSDNALAVRGPLLGQTKVGSAVFEGVMGQGRVFCSQLDAVSLWGRDSAATTYFHNLMAYICDPGKYLKNTPPIISRTVKFHAEPTRLRTIDLRTYANRGFSDEVENDGKGGWSDEGKNDFRMMRVGRQTVCNIPFDIIDPATNDGKSCLILKGSMRPNYPAAVKNIKIGGKYNRLFFLHSCAWGKGQEAGRYRINYEDGSHRDYLMVEGENVSNWWDCVFLPAGAIGMVMENPVKRNVCLSVAAWDNPWPDKKIVGMDFLCAGDNNVDTINYLPTNSPMPILVGITGEETHPFPLTIFNGEDTKQKWDAVTWRGGEAPKIRLVSAEKKPDNVYTGKYSAMVSMAARKDNGVPAILIRFPLGPIKKNNYKSLSFWIKPGVSTGSIEIVLPDATWKQYRISSVPLDTPGKWRKICLRIPEDMPSNGKEFPAEELRGELLIYNGNSKRAPNQYVPVEFFIDDVRFE